MTQVVPDNLNIHTFGPLFATFPPDEAWRLRRRLRFHYSPKHASRLNMAESELSVLGRQRLNRRVSCKEELVAEVTAWVADRNQAEARINWSFRVADVRRKVDHLYPRNPQW